MNPMSKTCRIAKTFLQGRVPGQLIIQYTDRCNAQCPQCGMRGSNDFPRTTLGVTKTKKIIAAAAQKGFAALSFTGGEPFMYLDEICQLSRFAAEQGINYIRTGTNGFMFMGSGKAGFDDRIKHLADKLAAAPIRNIWVSIDSSDPQVHEQMRGLPGVMQGIEKALPIFAERGIYLSANLGINRNFAGMTTADELSHQFFRTGFDRFYHLYHCYIDDTLHDYFYLIQQNKDKVQQSVDGMTFVVNRSASCSSIAEQRSSVSFFLISISSQAFGITGRSQWHHRHRQRSLLLLEYFPFEDH